MKILLTGATGLIGKSIGKALVAQGHELTVLTRNIAEAKSVLPFPAKILEWNNYKQDLSPDYFNDIESVIHLAGESIASGRWTQKRKKLIHDTRALGTKKIAEAILASNKTVKQFISASAIGIYGNTHTLTHEESAKGNDFLAKVCVEWEKEAQILSENKIKVIHPRIGIVLSRKGGALTKMIPIFSTGLGGVIGNGKQWMSWIHEEDLTNIFLFFINNPEVSGPFNAVSPSPVNNKEFSEVLAKSLGKKLFFPVPELALKIGLGDMSELVTGGQNVSSQKLSLAGFKFKYINLKNSLEEICSPLKGGKNELFYEVWLPKKVKDIFPFFSDERNLEKLTPDYLNFKVLNKSTESIQQGTIINYKLNLHGIPLRWTTLIEKWEQDEKFVDTQIKGPYSIWHHTHEFEDFANGTIVRDKIIYKLPLGRLGQLLGTNFVKSDVEKIFSYRKKVIAKFFVN